MSGGLIEIMAACIEGTPGSLSGFDAQTLAQEMDKGYIDRYPAGVTDTSYNKRILGDATGEVGPFYRYLEANGTNWTHSSWYAGLSMFIQADNPWFARGSHASDGVFANQFNIESGTGAGIYSIGFRIVISI